MGKWGYGFWVCWGCCGLRAMGSQSPSQSDTVLESALFAHLQVRHHHPEHFLFGDELFLAASLPRLDSRVDGPKSLVFPQQRPLQT